MAKKNDDTEAEAKTKASGKKSKDKDKGKGKGKGKGKDEQSPGSSIASHPRARGSVRRVKAWAGIAAFGIAAVLSLQASVPMLQVGERALGAGVVGYMLAWWFSVLIWRQLIIAEQRAALAEIEHRRSEPGEPRKTEAQPTGG